MAALYFFRWKSELISIGAWLVAWALAGVTSCLLTQEITATLVVLCISLLLVLCLCRMTPVVSIFGVFFLGSMLLPSIFGLIWLGELGGGISNYLNAGWFINTMLLIAGTILGILIIFNTAMLSWILLVRYSLLYFRFPRLLEGWEKAKKSEKNYPWVSIHVPCFHEPPRSGLGDS